MSSKILRKKETWIGVAGRFEKSFRITGFWGKGVETMKAD